MITQADKDLAAGTLAKLLAHPADADVILTEVLEDVRTRAIPVLKEYGGRVTSVDEEGEVNVFLYSAQTNFTLNVGSGGAKAWGARVGDYLTIQILDQKLAP